MAYRKDELIEWLQGIKGNPLIGIDDSGLALKVAARTIKENQAEYLEVGGMPEAFCPTCNDFTETEFHDDGRLTCLECGHLAERRE